MIYVLILCNLIIAAAGILSYPSLPPQVPLFYSKPFGEDQLGEIWMLLVLPLLMNLFVGINIRLSSTYFAENTYIKKVLYYCNLVLMIGFTGIFLKIVLLVD